MGEPETIQQLHRSLSHISAAIEVYEELCEEYTNPHNDESLLLTTKLPKSKSWKHQESYVSPIGVNQPDPVFLVFVTPDKAIRVLILILEDLKTQYRELSKKLKKVNVKLVSDE